MAVLFYLRNRIIKNFYQSCRSYKVYDVTLVTHQIKPSQGLHLKKYIFVCVTKVTVTYQ